MIIKKGEREYTVTELAHEWKVERNVGGVSVQYRIKKEGRAGRGGGQTVYHVQGGILTWRTVNGRPRPRQR